MTKKPVHSTEATLEQIASLRLKLWNIFIKIITLVTYFRAISVHCSRVYRALQKRSDANMFLIDLTRRLVMV